MTEKQELKKRFEAKQKNLEAQIAEIEATAEAKKNDASTTVQSTADQLREKLKNLKTAAAEGWDNITEEGAKRLNALLDRVDSSDDDRPSAGR